MSIYCQACNDQQSGVKGSPLTEHTCWGERPFSPNWVSKPGNTISDILNERGMDVQDFVVKMGMSKLDIAKLLLGELAIDKPIAKRLSATLGASVEFWMNRQRQYDEGRERLKLA